MEFTIATEGLTKSFGGFKAVDGVNLKVRRGTIHALIGPNGAGKTTVFNLLTKFLQPTEGRIFFDGRDITRRQPYEIAEMGMVRSFQISAVFPRMTARENVRVALQRAAGRGYQFWRHNSSLDRLDQIDRKVEEALRAVDLIDDIDVPVMEMSYGRKRALEIATTISLDPKLLLLDEPMAGLGQADIERISQLIRQLGKDRTILMVEHNLPVVAAICSTITVLTRGKILAEGDYEAISRNEAVQTAYLGAGDE